MRFRRTARVVTSWMAVLAILMAAIAPSISHALGSKNASWVEVCSSQGAKWVKAGADAGDNTPVPSASHPFEHCPYCSLHAHAAAIPAASVAAVPLLPSAHDRPVAILAAPRILHAWVSAQPRAPPLFS